MGVSDDKEGTERCIECRGLNVMPACDSLPAGLDGGAASGRLTDSAMDESSRTRWSRIEITAEVDKTLEDISPEISGASSKQQAELRPAAAAKPLLNSPKGLNRRPGRKSR